MSTAISHQDSNEQNLDKDIIRSELRQKLEGTNINPCTFLTTDYLNHFSAILMLLEMLPQDPELFAVDILSWKPATYAEHLTDSGFRDNELAIECYENASPDVRMAFDKIIAQLDDATKLIIENINQALEQGNIEHVSKICDIGIPQMKELIEQAAGIVNDDKELIAGLCADESDSASQSTFSQNDIDALFD